MTQERLANEFDVWDFDRPRRLVREGFQNGLFIEVEYTYREDCPPSIHHVTVHTESNLGFTHPSTPELLALLGANWVDEFFELN